MTMWMFQTIGTAAFFAGVVLLLVELARRGLTKLSALSYACFVASSIFLSNSILSCVLAIAGLSVLFGILLFFYRREQRRTKSRSGRRKDRSKP
ncbi:hypothetical protein [Christensenella massiliensis]|uniref:Uncharacterized protein n=1 Tax=Christensenella massiliensis TaxID=1805714 RepID=A0AAU8A7Z0_9FIRM